MPEDSGKKRYIQDFLTSVQNGTGFLEDIRIERAVRAPGSKGEASTAKSLSGRPISNIRELLEDDLKRSFDEGYFTFRFVAALKGSGKSSILNYLHQLAKTQPNYRNYSVVVQFQLSDLHTSSGTQPFRIKLYCHLLAHTFHQLLHNPNLSPKAKEVGEELLGDILIDNHQVISQLKSAKDFKLQFSPKFTKYVSQIDLNFKDFLFDLITKVSRVEPRFTFVYLNDELDGLQPFPDAIRDTRFVFEKIIRDSYEVYQSKIRLLIYIVGTSNHVQGFIGDDSVLHSLITDSVINLSKGYSDEFEKIRVKIDQRIKGAYKGYKNFDAAWQEIQQIEIPADIYGGNLRKFCQYYASAMLAIHAKYFEEAPEQKFEGDARQLLEAECRHYWGEYLKKSSYTLSECSTTTVLKGHAFDAYIKLLHNGIAAAEAYGEAKNYELLKAHLETFERWLKDVDFKPASDPPDLAFMIAPSCPTLLQRKLEIKNIKYIEAPKILDTNKAIKKEHSIENSTIPNESTNIPEENSKPETEIQPSSNRDLGNEEKSAKPKIIKDTVNINKASREQFVNAFKGARIHGTNFESIIKGRNPQPFTDLNDLFSRVKLTPKVQEKFQAKFDNGEISF